MAMLHYGKKTANPKYEVLLTYGEKDYLDGYVVQQRWSQLWLDKHAGSFDHFSSH